MRGLGSFGKTVGTAALVMSCSHATPQPCASLAVCQAHDGHEVVVEGIYRPRGTDPRDEASLGYVIAIGPDDIGLGAFWHESAVRSPGEVARFKGKRVRVTGTYAARTPPPDARMGTIDGPAIHPVRSIVPAD